MREYLDLVQTVLEKGEECINRTEVKTKTIYNYHYKIDLTKGFPLLTTKKMDGFRWNSLVKELIWFLSGTPNIKKFRKHSKIWEEWADNKGRLETAYGRYWRAYPEIRVYNLADGEASVSSSVSPVTGKKPKEEYEDYIGYYDSDKYYGTNGIDQIKYLVDKLKNNPKSRRMVLNSWHPDNAIDSKLPPCHFSAVFNVDNNSRIHCHLNQRSGDVGLGIPFNIASYSLLTHLLAKETELQVGTFSHIINNCHIYINHIDGLKEQVKREPLDLPTISLPDKSLFDLEFKDFDKFKLNNYKSYSSIELNVVP